MTDTVSTASTDLLQKCPCIMHILIVLLIVVMYQSMVALPCSITRILNGTSEGMQGAYNIHGTHLGRTGAMVTGPLAVPAYQRSAQTSHDGVLQPPESFFGGPEPPLFWNTGKLSISRDVRNSVLTKDGANRNVPGADSDEPVPDSFFEDRVWG